MELIRHTVREENPTQQIALKYGNIVTKSKEQWYGVVAQPVQQS